MISAEGVSQPLLPNSFKINFFKPKSMKRGESIEHTILFCYEKQKLNCLNTCLKNLSLDLIDVDLAIRGTDEQVQVVIGPGDGDGPGGALAGPSNGLVFGDGRAVLIEDGLVLEIPELDTGVSGGDQPVVLGREAQGVDGGTGIERVQVLAFGDIPQHDGHVLTTGGAERAIGGNGDGVDGAVVSDQLGSQLHGGDVPDHDGLVPAGGDQQGGLGGGGESDAGDPVGVLVFLEGVLALTKSVPKTNGLVTGSRDDLTVVLGKGNGVNVGSVAVEDADGRTGGEVPQTEGLVPRTGEGKLTIGGDDDIGDGARVTSHSASGVTGLLIIRGQDKSHDGLVTGTGDQQVRLSIGGGQRGNPASVSLEGTAMFESFGHGCLFFVESN